jgi:hypothetical protein
VLVLILLTGLSLPCAAADHLVSPGLAERELVSASAARAADLERIDSVLASSAAEQAAQRVGVDLGRVRAAAAALSDDELRDLASRTRALEGDPAAGLDPDIRQLLVIFLIIAIVILVLQAVD